MTVQVFLRPLEHGRRSGRQRNKQANLIHKLENRYSTFSEFSVASNENTHGSIFLQTVTEPIPPELLF